MYINKVLKSQYLIIVCGYIRNMFFLLCVIELCSAKPPYRLLMYSGGTECSVDFAGDVVQFEMESVKGTLPFTALHLAAQHCKN